MTSSPAPVKKHSAVEWLDFHKPSKEDLALLRERFGIHEVILNELEGPSARSKVETYDDYLYLVYYFPAYDPNEQSSRRTEISFVVTKTAVITAHYEPVEFFKEAKNIEAPDSLRLLYALLGGLFRFEERQLRHVREKVEAVGNELFKDKERDILGKISRLKRDISEYRLIVRAEEGVLNSLRDHGLVFWGESARVYLNDLAGDHLRIVNQIGDYRQTILDFENTNKQIMDVKATEVMKRFTAMSFLTFPFVLFVAIFDIHLPDNPLVQQQEGFWIVFGAVVLGILSLAAIFKRKGWM